MDIQSFRPSCSAQASTVATFTPHTTKGLETEIGPYRRNMRTGSKVESSRRLELLFEQKYED